MSKEVIEIHIPNLKQLIKEHKGNDAIFETLDYCIELLTPPTAEDVCKALSEWFGEFVQYYDGFYIDKSTKNYRKIEFITTKIGDNYKVDRPLPPHLMTLIGRFYEGVDSNGKNV